MQWITDGTVTKAEVDGRIGSAAKNRRGMDVGAQIACFVFLCYPVQIPVWDSVTYIPSVKHPPRHIQRCVSELILKPVKLTAESQKAGKAELTWLLRHQCPLSTQLAPKDGLS